MLNPHRLGCSTGNVSIPLEDCQANSSLDGELGYVMATIQDVARVAGVGISTVSRVLNNHPGVRPDTRERVLNAIAQLHFKPNPIARSMISKRTNTIGVIMPFFTRIFQSEVLQAVQRALSRANKELILYSVETDIQRDHYFSEIPMHRKVDGLLVISLSPEESFARRFREVGLPVVLVDSYSTHISSLVVDNMEGAYLAVKSLIAKGHQHIGLINGKREGNFKFNQANDRLIGFHRALSEAQILFDPDLLVESEWDRHDAQTAALHLLTHRERPTAIFAASDIQAFGALEAARILHITVPEELSVIGFDGIELSELFGLSTVQQPIKQMGEMGIVKLLELIDNPQREPELIRLPTQLVERRTTGPAPRLRES